MFSQQNYFTDLLMLMLNRRLPLIIKVMLISILILKAIGSKAIGTMEFCRLFCHSKISLICLIYLSFPNLFLYHQIHNNVFESSKEGKFQSAYRNRLFLIIDLLLFAKLLELLAINHSSSERRIIFCSLVVEIIPCSGCFMTCMGAHFLAVELDNAIWFSTLFQDVRVSVAQL